MRTFLMWMFSRSSTYDPFLDLSVPIYRESESSTPSSRTSFLGTLRNTVSGATGGGGSDGNKSTLEKCLEKFTGECAFHLFVLSPLWC
jgi:hypothetical protein